jgi:hypothetical protein
LESSNVQIPNGGKLLKPTPMYCFKIPYLTKIFVNMCTSNLIEQATKTHTNNEQGNGQQWKLPFSLSPPRDFNDASNKINKQII